MRKKSVVFTIMILFLTCASSLFAFDPNLPEPLAWYTFNEGSGSLAYECMGSGYNGTIFGAEYVDMGGGNYALDFAPTGSEEGDGDYVDFGDLPLGSWPGNWTIEAWVKYRTKYSVGGNAFCIMGQEELYSGIIGGDKFLGHPGAYNPNVKSLTSSVGQWYHVTYVHHGDAEQDAPQGRQYMYINGVLVSGDGENIGVGGRNNSARYSWVAGKRGTQWLDGQIDEIRLYDVALPADRVLYSYQKGSTKPALPDPEKPEPIAWYTFNEGSGNIAYDHSVYGNDGEIFGGAEYVVSGNNNYALDFSTSNGEPNGEYVNFGDLPLSNMPNCWTIEVWVKYRTKYSFGGNGFWLMGQDELESGLKGGDKFLGHPGSFNPYVKSLVSSAGQWYHVAYVQDGNAEPAPYGRQYMYIDGVLVSGVGENDGVGSRNNYARYPWIAGKNTSATSYQWLDGQIDEIRLYDKALTADQVENSYNVGSTPILPPVDCAEAIRRGHRMKGDVNGDCYVNIADIAEMAESWLVCNDPADTVNCIMNW